MNENERVEKKRTSSPPRGGGRRKNFGVRYPFEFKLRAVKLHLEEGFAATLVAEETGASVSVIHQWVAVYRARGEEGLRAIATSHREGKVPVPVREQILQIKKENPGFGVKRISQFLRRFFLMQASPETVRRRLKQEGLIQSPPRPRRNLVRPRFFERATPNQMWQTDIFTFRLGGRYAYLIGFLDDYSRFIVGADLFRSPTAENVLEVFRVASGEFQPPKEMLTDNGRQYTNWRGVSRFEAEMKKNGIHQFKSRPHHPMTLGKIERFWETIWQEFLTRAQFESFEAARERIRFWIRYYNHKRPHQGIEGLCPADRYFEIASDLRKTIEAGIKENLLEMALRGEPQAPFYMVGRMEGQSVILRAEKGKLKLSVDNGNENKELTYDLKQAGQEPKAADGSEPQCDREGPGDPGGVDGALQSLGGLSAAGHKLHDLPALATPGHGGDAPSAGIRGEPGPGGSLESAPAIPVAQSAKDHEHPQIGQPLGANRACQHGGKSEKDGVNDSLTETSERYPSSPVGADHGPAGSPGVGRLPSGLLQMGEARAQGNDQRRGGSAQGPAQSGKGPGEGTAPEPGRATGT